MRGSSWVRLLSLIDSFGQHIIVGAVATAVTPVKDESPLKRLKDEILSVTSSEESEGSASFDSNENESTVSITVVGASGDLAKKKIFPALFALYYEDCLPKVRFWSSSFIIIFGKIWF